MSDITDPTDLFEVPEDQRLDVDEDHSGEEIEGIAAFREELRGEVIELDTGGLEAAGGFSPFESSKSPCSGGPTPGASALAAYIDDRFSEARVWGIYECRNVAGTTDVPSQHSEGRAIDFGIPTTSSGKARPDLGDPVVDLLRSEGRALGIQHLIYNRQQWGANYPSGKAYNGSKPHYNHVHVALTREAAARLNYTTVESILGGATVVDTPDVEGVTHRVATQTSGLNVRSQPATSGSVVGNLPKGTRVAAQPGPAQESNGRQWIKIKAAHQGQIIEGWVAAEFLDAVAAPAERTTDATTPHDDAAPPAVQGATHRVATERNDLRMRSQPTTTAGDNILTELPNGTQVVALSDSVQHADGHPWLRVRATVGGRTYEGWVASDLLEPIG